MQKSMDAYRRHRSHLLVLFIVLAGVVACSQVGLPTAANLEQSIAYVYPANATLRDTAATLLVNKKISKAEAQSVLAITDAVRLAADAAKAYVQAGDNAKAQASLTLAMEAMKQAQVFVDRYKGT